ncbi:hypothetical protein [Klebsiella phage vB_KpnM_VAC13]|nr:hypothetical protein [Klebsiella phage vB_KpnM_VAC13]
MDNWKTWISIIVGVIIGRGLYDLIFSAGVHYGHWFG